MSGIGEGVVRPIAVGYDGSVALEVDTSIYEVNAILRSCYKFTDRCYIFIVRNGESPQVVSILISPKKSPQDLAPLIGELCNELLDQQVRESLAREMGFVRDMIVAQAFSEGNLLDPLRDDGDYTEDPLGIGSRR